MTLSRRTPLKRGGPLPRSSLPLRRTPLASVSALARTPFVAKRAKRSPEENQARALVAARSNGTCEGCGWAPASEWAHRVARSRGGLWAASNGLHLCSSGDPRSPWGGGLGCHEWSHKNPVEARSVGWILRRGQDSTAIPVLLPVIGWALLADDGSITPIERTTS